MYPNDPGLQEGMILSDEPGYYEDGSFGIRIESLVRVVRAQTRHYSCQRTFAKFSQSTVPGEGPY